MRLNADLIRLAHAARKVDSWIKQEVGSRPRIGIVLGSGLGSYPQQFDGRSVPYTEIGLPRPAVEGHEGKLYCSSIEGRNVLILSGRVHYYECLDFEEVVFNVRTLMMAGVKNFIITCAAGIVNRNICRGDVVVLTDHINLAFASPLQGQNVPAVGPRFPSMCKAYDPELRAAALDTEPVLLKTGVYAMNSGPQYETPAEVEMLRKLGVDLVGMSTVPETIALRHMGGNVLGLACATNYAGEEGDHQEVIEAAGRASGLLSKVLTAVIGRIPG